MVGREAVIEKLTWKVLLENKVSKETGPGETEKLRLSLGNTGLIRKKISSRIFQISHNGKEEFSHLLKIKATLLICLSQILNRS